MITEGLLPDIDKNGGGEMGFEVTEISGVANAYLLTGDAVALVDTMTPKGFRKIEKALAGKGLGVKDVDFILITHHHYDHAGCAAKVKELSGATVIAGAEDAPVLDGSQPNPPPGTLNRLGRLARRLPKSLVESYQRYPKFKVDRTVSGGEVIEELGLEVIALPGHTRGGVGYLDRDGRRAFIGDMVSNFLGRPGMPALLASHSLEQIFESQEALAALELEIAYPGHGRVIRPDASRVIAEYAAKKRKKAGSLTG